MKLLAFVLLDTKVGVFHAPFFMAHPAQAVRACADLAGDLSTTVGRHPSDFALVQVGYFDDQSGQLTPEAPTQLGVCSAFLAPPKGAQPMFDELAIPPRPVANGNGERV